MTDREKLVEMLAETVSITAYKQGGEWEYSFNLEEVVDYLISRGVTVKEPQEPFLRGQLVDCGFFFFERKEEEEVYPVVLKEGLKAYLVDFVGTGHLVRHDKADYSKTWRCWAEKPTEEERKAAEWER